MRSSNWMNHAFCNAVHVNVRIVFRIEDNGISIEEISNANEPRSFSPRASTLLLGCAPTRSRILDKEIRYERV